MSFMFIGLGPVSAAWAWHWVRAGFSAERQKSPQMDEAIRVAIAKRIEIGHQIVATSYCYDSGKMLHVFKLSRGEESGHLAFSSEFIRDHTASGVIQRLTSPEVRRQFDSFGGKILIVNNIGVRVELGV